MSGDPKQPRSAYPWSSVRRITKFGGRSLRSFGKPASLVAKIAKTTDNEISAEIRFDCFDMALLVLDRGFL